MSKNRTATCITTTVAAEVVAGNDDLLEQILIRLPAKSLARFKVVKKQWLSFISSTQFVQAHCHRNRDQFPTGMFITDVKANRRRPNFFVSLNALDQTYQAIPSLDFLYDEICPPFVEAEAEIVILRSCYGLLLCFVKLFPSKDPPNYCICNPTTKKFKLLPRAPYKMTGEAYLAFDPSVSLHYKVICTTHHSFKRKIQVYSSDDQSWRAYDHKIPAPCPGGLFFNGSIYWLYKDFALCFDVDTQKMTKVDAPPDDQSLRACEFSLYLYSYLPVTGSHLYFTGGCGGSHIHLLEMSRDFSKWVAKYDDVSIYPMLSAFPQIAVLQGEKMEYCYEAICVLEGVKEEESVLVLAIPGKIIVYDFIEKTTKELCDWQGELKLYMHRNFVHFIESLALV